jgi:hypothetical protein
MVSGMGSGKKGRSGWRDGRGRVGGGKKLHREHRGKSAESTEENSNGRPEFSASVFGWMYCGNVTSAIYKILRLAVETRSNGVFKAVRGWV